MSILGMMAFKVSVVRGQATLKPLFERLKHGSFTF